nr:6-hydroxypseudooxynicotine dehydrogenase complex subunit alpha-like [Nerophis lumbriciformis]
MKPAPFEYHRPDTLAEALALLAEHGDAAKPLAGGQSLVPAMSFRLAQPGTLIDLNRLDELSGIEPTAAGGLKIGAMTRHSAAEHSGLIAERAPLLHQVMPWIAHPQIRNRGTVGGSLAHADPAAELPAVMLALGARFHLQSQIGQRVVAAEDFYTSLFETAMEPGELLTAIELPPTPVGACSAFSEFARRHGDYALVGVAVQLIRAPDGTLTDAKLCYLSVGDTPIEAKTAQAMLTGQQPSRELFEAAAATAASLDIDPPGDIHASVAYRRQLVRVLTRRVIEAAMAP